MHVGRVVDRPHVDVLVERVGMPEQCRREDAQAVVHFGNRSATPGPASAPASQDDGLSLIASVPSLLCAVAMRPRESA